MAPNFIKEFHKGQASLAETLKLLVLKEDEYLFSLLDFRDDTIFLEPFLVIYFNNKESKEITLWQILFGYLKGIKLSRELSFKAYSNANGQIYLPRIGYFNVELKNTLFDVSHENGKLSIFLNNKKTEGSFLPIAFLKNTKIEVYQTNNPLFVPSFSLFLREEKNIISENVMVRSLYDQNLKKLNKAYQILKKSGLNYFTVLDQSTRGIFSFEHKELWSFADKSSHGISFIAGYPTDSTVFFICELAHQGGHTAFNSIISNTEKIFLIDPNTQINSLIEKPSDTRTLLGALHGLYTTSKVAEALNYIYTSKLKFNNDQKHEIAGRLSDNYYRHRTGLEKINPEKIFTKQGLNLYRSLDNYLTSVYRKYNLQIGKYDQSNRQFVFNYDNFKALNPFN